MNVIDAAQATVKAYPGGAESLAPRLGMSGALLRGKVNPNSDRNHLTLAEADELMATTGDHRILQALAAEHGYSLERLASRKHQGGIALHVMSLNAEQGKLAQELHDAFADGSISPNEMQAIAGAEQAVQEVLISLIQRLRQQVERPSEVR
jgi:hypothetical protein